MHPARSSCGAAVQLFAQIEVQGLTVDVLINNAGFGKYGPFGTQPLTAYQQMVALNITALTDLCHLYLPGMRQRRRGGILNVASLAGFTPTPYLGVYGATKAYVLSLSQALAAEVEDDHVQISVLCPGSTATEFGTVGASNATELTTPDARMGSMSAQAVARLGLAGFEAGKVIIVTGWSNKAVALGAGLMPRGLLRRGAKRVFSRREFLRGMNITTDKPNPKRSGSALK